MKQFYEDAADSQGNSIAIEDLLITVNSQKIEYPFIEQINYSTNLLVCYSFLDNNIKGSKGKSILISETLTLIYKKRNTEFKGSNEIHPLIHPIGGKYIFNILPLDRLIKQINSLWLDNESYDMCLASSIRLVFDLATYNYEVLSGYKFNKRDLDLKVETLISNIIADNKGFSELSNMLNIRYSVIKNLFEDPKQFGIRVTRSNLGAHTGITHLTKADIEDMAKYAGFYAQLVDAYCIVKGFK